MASDEVSRAHFRLLGPVEVWVDDRRVDSGQPRQQAVLAALLVDAGRVVPTETLIARVWGPLIPQQAQATLRTHLSRIRRLLEQTEAVAGPAGTLSHGAGGYLLRIDPDQVDLHRYRRLAGAATVESLRAALALWRGQPLAGIDGEWAGRMREIWGRERVDTVVRWARAELADANPGPVLAGLPELASDNPLIEPLTEVLMLALHATGRTNEALDLYARTRRHLADELGTDPGQDLQLLHRSLLRGEVPTAPGPSHPASLDTGPRQLPAPPQLFTGRFMELAELDKIHDASTVVITAIDGMAGVGKTALAVQAAHRMVHRYPDGQLFIDLHGYTEGVARVEPAEALDWMLRSLGVPGAQIPAGLDQRAALFRSRLAEQRMVIVLDNAATEAQVIPLLPGAPGCVVLVTSRRQLAGLDQTRALSLDTLPLPDAIALLRQTAGDSRLAGQPPPLVEQLVELCGRLPLAIRIAAARLRSHPTWDLDHLVTRLGDQQHILVEFEAGQRSVAAALDLSYQDLDADRRRTYRLLGLHPGADIDPYAAAALLDATARDAGWALEHLMGAHLLQEPTPGRYRFHDLTRAHAAQTAARDETSHDVHAALDRLLDHYRHTAVVAMDAAYPYERDRRPQVPPSRTPDRDLSDPAAALDWLDRELRNLLTAAKYAAEHERPEHLLHLSTILRRHLRTRGRYQDAVALHRQALATAHAPGHQPAEVDALVGLGHIYIQQGQHEQATDHYQQALRLARAIGYQAGEVDALVAFGIVHFLQGRSEQATDHYQQALQLARAADHRNGALEPLVGLGHLHRMQGRYEQAIDHFQQALPLARATGHQPAEMDVLVGLGTIHRQLGQYESATDHYQQAMQLARATGHRTGELNALTGLGHVHRLQGLHEQATDHYQRLLELADQSGSLNYQFEAWQGLGRLHHSTGHPDAALAHHDQALALATEMDQPVDQSRAHEGLARAYHALHQSEQAQTHWQHALDILTRLGSDRTDEETTVAAIRAHLMNLQTGTT